MRQFTQGRATSEYPARIAFLIFWCLSMGSLSSLSGCSLDYSMKHKVDDSSGTITETATFSTTGDNTDTETGSESETIPCPTTLEFQPPIRFTETIVCDKPSQEYMDSCPAGQAIVGFVGFLRDYDEVHARIRAICGIPVVKAVGGECIVEVSPGDLLPVYGTSGSEEWNRACPDNGFLMGFKAQTGDNYDKVIFRCAPLLVARKGDHFVVTRGPFSDLEPIGKDDGKIRFQQDCISGQIATTATIQADTVIRALGLGCQTPSPR